MKLFEVLFNKPWTHQGDGASLAAGDLGSLLSSPQSIALRMFLGVVGVLFGLFITAYFIRMELADWRPMPESQLLWVNTGILFACSVILQWTRNCLHQVDAGLDNEISTNGSSVIETRDNKTKVKWGLMLGGLLTIGFLLGQLMVWRVMSESGYYLASNPANSFFYVLTGLHGLHILGGLWVWSKSTIKVWFGGALESVRLSVELCAVYWHFLLLVWLVIFALLSYT